MMTGNQQTTTGSGESVQPTYTNTVHPATAGTSTTPKMNNERKQPVVETQQPEMKRQGDRINPTLSRALVGGLVGATLGMVAGALAGRKASQGLTHAKEGVGRALKTVGQGLNQTGEGMGEAIKSVAEGVSYAVVGGTAEVAQDITNGAKQIGNTTAEVMQSTANSVTQTVQSTAQTVTQTARGVSDSIQHSAEETQQSVVDAVESDPAVSCNEKSITGTISGLQPIVDTSYDAELQEITPDDARITLNLDNV
jgi:gas vesicle protein